MTIIMKVTYFGVTTDVHVMTDVQFAAQREIKGSTNLDIF